MQIDRARFLVLSASLAGCVVHAPPPQPQPQPEPTGTAPSTAPNVEGPPPPTVEGAPKPPPSAEGSPFGEGYGPAGEGTPAGEGYTPSTEGAPGLKKLGVPVGTWKCGAGGDEIGAAVTCAQKAPDCKWSQDSCKGASKYFKPKIAERAASCINQIGTAACGMGTYDCRKAALRSACPDSTVDAACKQAMAGCKKVKMHECRLWLTGLNAAGRAEAVKCISNQTYCGFGMYSCVEGLG